MTLTRTLNKKFNFIYGRDRGFFVFFLCTRMGVRYKKVDSQGKRKSFKYSFYKSFGGLSRTLLCRSGYNQITIFINSWVEPGLRVNVLRRKWWICTYINTDIYLWFYSYFLQTTLGDYSPWSIVHINYGNGKLNIRIKQRILHFS